MSIILLKLIQYNVEVNITLMVVLYQYALHNYIKQLKYNIMKLIYNNTIFSCYYLIM